jgi:hypothetical protein
MELLPRLFKLVIKISSTVVLISCSTPMPLYSSPSTDKPKANLTFDAQYGWFAHFQINKTAAADGCAWERVDGQTRSGIYLMTTNKSTPINLPAGQEVAVTALMGSSGTTCSPPGVVFFVDPEQTYQAKAAIRVDQGKPRAASTSCYLEISRQVSGGNFVPISARPAVGQSCK